MTGASQAMTPEFENWMRLIAARIAPKLDPKRVRTLEDVRRVVGDKEIKEAHRELQAFIAEMADGQTERSQLARTVLARSIYDSIPEKG